MCRHHRLAMLLCLLLPGHLTVDVPLLWLPPSVVPVLIRQCTTVNPVLKPTRVVFVRVWHLHGGKRPSGWGVPGLYQGRLPVEVLLLLAVRRVAFAHVLLPSLGRLTGTARSSSPVLILCLWWHSYAFLADYRRPRQSVIRSEDSWQHCRTTTYPLPLHISCLSAECIWTFWLTSTPESCHRCLVCARVRPWSCFCTRVSAVGSFTTFRARSLLSSRHWITM